MLSSTSCTEHSNNFRRIPQLDLVGSFRSVQWRFGQASEITARAKEKKVNLAASEAKARRYKRSCFPI